MDLPTSGNKPDLVERLLKEQLELGNLNLQQLQGICEAEDLPKDGAKQTLVKRLVKGQEGALSSPLSSAAGRRGAGVLKESSGSAAVAAAGGAAGTAGDGDGDGSKGGKAGKGGRPTEVYEAVSKARAKRLNQQEETLAEVQRAPRAMVSNSSAAAGI